MACVMMPHHLYRSSSIDESYVVTSNFETILVGTVLASHQASPGRSEGAVKWCHAFAIAGSGCKKVGVMPASTQGSRLLLISVLFSCHKPSPALVQRYRQFADLSALQRPITASACDCSKFGVVPSAWPQSFLFFQERRKRLSLRLLEPPSLTLSPSLTKTHCVSLVCRPVRSPTTYHSVHV